ncbi:unnamed protein product [Haemonchus placei]|uniref:Hyaluronidase n=1 Tax=Haemonchus placei TaxID=6290 RepID=A0A0N4WR52_HAEPC|nr:unnamed protein product [Haemonchus placei]
MLPSLKTQPLGRSRRPLPDRPDIPCRDRRQAIQIAIFVLGPTHNQLIAECERQQRLHLFLSRADVVQVTRHKKHSIPFVTETVCSDGSSVRLAFRGFNFTGEKIVIFYEKKFGLCPYYENNDPKRPVNGGIPQVYKKQSIAFVKARFPELSRKEANKQAEKEFNKAAREFFTQTLQLAVKLRPKGRWGYYDYPFCNGNAGDLPDDFSCKEEAKRYNNKLAFIYNASTALFPSIYLNGKKTPTQSFRYVQALLKETKRIANEQKRRPNFFAYTKFEYDPRTDYTWFYNKEDLCSTVKQPADLGARGLVLWSTSTDMKDRCYGIANYVDTQFGP